MFLITMDRELIGGGHTCDDNELSSSEVSRKASRNARISYEGCNASTNPIPRVKLVDTNILLTIQCAIFYSVLHSVFYSVFYFLFSIKSMKAAVHQ